MRLSPLLLFVIVLLLLEGCARPLATEISRKGPAQVTASPGPDNFEKSGSSYFIKLEVIRPNGRGLSAITTTYNISTSSQGFVCTLDGDVAGSEFYVYAIGAHQWMRSDGKVHVPNFALPPRAQREWQVRVYFGGGYRTVGLEPGESYRRTYDLSKRFSLDSVSDYVIYATDPYGTEVCASCISWGTGHGFD